MVAINKIVCKWHNTKKEQMGPNSEYAISFRRLYKQIFNDFLLLLSQLNIVGLSILNFHHSLRFWWMARIRFERDVGLYNIIVYVVINLCLLSFIFYWIKVVCFTLSSSSPLAFRGKCSKITGCWICNIGVASYYLSLCVFFKLLLIWVRNWNWVFPSTRGSPFLLYQNS